MRYELKFKLEAAQYFILREKLRLMLRPDGFAADNRTYKVWSLYYDTSELELFYQKVNGEYEHLKLRLRCYDGHFDPRCSAVFAECKIKYQDRQDKWRWRLDQIPKHQALWQSYGERYPLVGKLIDARAIFPTSYVYYQREPMVGVIGNQKVRLNFDTDIAAARPQPQVDQAKQAHGGYQRLPVEFSALLEVKVADPEISPELNHALQSVGARQTTFSKYGAALETIGSERLALGVLV